MAPHLRDFDPDEPPTGRLPAFDRDVERVRGILDILSAPERELAIRLLAAWVATDHTKRALLVGYAEASP